MILGMPSKVEKYNIFTLLLSLFGHIAVSISYIITVFLILYILIEAPSHVFAYYQNILTEYGNKIGLAFLISAFLILVVVLSILIAIIFALKDAFNKKEVNVDIHYIDNIKGGTFEVSWGRKVIRARHDKTRVLYYEDSKTILIEFKYGFLKKLRVTSVNSGDTYEKLTKVFDSLGAKVNFIDTRNLA